MSTGQPVFLLQIVRVDTKEVVRLEAGGPLELQLVETIAAEVSRALVRRPWAVKRAVTEGLTRAMTALKQETRAVLLPKR